ncbi:MAG TPA: hypothetical protein VEB42_08310, partial [Chitinophagaceae bacterium]|nr:hypothetical protein [Chitinophagaceae bacterium]
NQFDDLLLLIYKDNVGTWNMNVFPITTDPGKPYLMQPLSQAGTAILVPGQYAGAYKLGIHGRSKPAHKQYTALEQQKPMRYVRDKNRDAVVDTTLYADEKNLFWDNIKSNIHRGNPGWLSKLGYRYLVNNYSAACQVFQYADHFDQFIDLCRTSAILYNNSFTYTLLEESDFS